MRCTMFAGTQIKRMLPKYTSREAVREAGFGRLVQVFEPSKHMLRAKKPSCSKAPK